MSDEQLKSIQADYPGIKPDCLEKLKYGGVQALPRETDQCFEMTSSQRWQGLWRDEFEGSVFCPSPAKECSSIRPDGTWLSYTDKLRHAGTRPAEGAGGLYRVEFIGRKALKPGHYGHMGYFANEIIVDQLISARQLEPPPAPPS
jgi:hypothetical protein